MKWLIVWSISLYQKYLSPRKGFVCAHRRLYGNHSCSTAIKLIIVHKGCLGGLHAIRTRLRECQMAATRLRQQSPVPRSDLDCSLGGCNSIGDNVSDCFGGSGSASSGSPSTTTSPIVFIPVSILAFIIIFAVLYWVHGRQIATIEIRLIDATQEVKDRRLIPMFDNRLPDYRVIFTTDNQTIETNTRQDTSASDWITLHLQRSIPFSSISQFSVVNKQILNDQQLETIIAPAMEGKGKVFEYKFQRNWHLF